MHPVPAGDSRSNTTFAASPMIRSVGGGGGWGVRRLADNIRLVGIVYIRTTLSMEVREDGDLRSCLEICLSTRKAVLRSIRRTSQKCSPTPIPLRYSCRAGRKGPSRCITFSAGASRPCWRASLSRQARRRRFYRQTVPGHRPAQQPAPHEATFAASPPGSWPSPLAGAPAYIGLFISVTITPSKNGSYKSQAHCPACRPGKLQQPRASGAPPSTSTARVT